MSSMRKVRYFVANSLDGFISRLDGSVDWLFMDQDYGMAEFFATVDTAVMGRKTYDKMQELAPGQSFGPQIKSFVFSRRHPQGKCSAFTFLNQPIAPWLHSIQSLPGKDIWVVGGGQLVQQFLSEKLIDEICLTVHPRLLGQGTALFPSPYPETELELQQCKQYATGLLQVSYSVKREAA